MSILSKSKDRQYRECVGIMIYGKRGIFVGKRFDYLQYEKHWQMPQGGVDPGESVEQAMWRELYEETGLTDKSVKLLTKTSDYFYYEIPLHVRKNIWNGCFVGQRQIWFLLQFHGTDQDISIVQEPREFVEWKWVSFDQLLELIVSFKKDLYKKVIQCFSSYLQSK